MEKIISTYNRFCIDFLINRNICYIGGKIFNSLLVTYAPYKNYHHEIHKFMPKQIQSHICISVKNSSMMTKQKQLTKLNTKMGKLKLSREPRKNEKSC